MDAEEALDSAGPWLPMVHWRPAASEPGSHGKCSLPSALFSALVVNAGILGDGEGRNVAQEPRAGLHRCDPSAKMEQIAESSGAGPSLEHGHTQTGLSS